MLVALLLLIGVVAVAGVVLAMLRRWTLAEGRVEERLARPDASTVSYRVPAGQDATVLLSALSHEGYTAVTSHEGGQERVVVECPDEAERTRVRHVLEQVRRTGLEGAEMPATHVSFDDER